MQIRIIGAALAALCVAAPASAQECTKPLTLISSLPMTRWHDSELVTIPVSLNGVEKQFLFDTGGYFTQISPAAIEELKIPKHFGDAKQEMYAEDGTRTRDMVTVSTFGVGPLHAQNYDIPVLANAGYDGKFSPVGYKTVDFDLDFAAAKVNILSSNHCEGKVFYWPHQVSAALPFTQQDNKVTVPVTLDGKAFKAIIDTGASTSSMGMQEAQAAFGLHPDSPNMTVVKGAGNAANAPVFTYPFKTLTFGDITVGNPHIRISSDVVSATANSRKASATDVPEVTIGMDVLRKLHLYLALNENKLYMTEAGAPAAAAANPTAQPASTTQ